MRVRDGDDTDTAPILRAVERRLPAHYASQEEILGALRDLWATRHFNLERLDDLHRAVLVSGRNLALPLADYPALERFQQRNDAWIRVAVDLAEEAVRGALARAGLEPRDVDHIFFVTVTGIATPSIDARLVNRLGLRPDVRRTPIFGLGCVAGAAGTARAADYLRGYPDHVAVLVSVELCSLTLQREDLSVPNIIASALFGDGAAALVMEGSRRAARAVARDGVAARRGPRVLDTRSVFYPDTERIMGWDVMDSGFKVVLSAKVPDLVKSRARGDVDAFLASHDLRRDDVRWWVAHTGGPKVLTAMEESLELGPDALRRSWNSLREHGNLSSASVLFVLGDTLDADEAKPGDHGFMMAMGPGFCSEMVLLQW
ncbi:type III polyketide synthase [Chondromyces apiculatus]|uniref:Chalcone and stilbene synthases domain protein n=1 Tax=Chondromyces apiculatus DSM 436 TaxID=1192034 RepID=A0A017TCJ2_9BACT|nr:3-oxoacyl-[acyl-carrier-protein] synthase III C-terminal domain-containing protein [Chondromyces apiculatus]EYF06520.1 Chalcone and stilbene synthases domain protein [Chondromyces apiculatus DSM 436]